MTHSRMIVLFTDFGVTGPYIGQMKSVLHSIAPSVPIIDLFADAPCFDPFAAAHLLAAYVCDFVPETIFLCVVDPGVGSALRRPIVAEIDGRCFVGPDNGLFDVVAKRASSATKREILWQPLRLSASFHGRDLFAPLAARLASGSVPDGWLGDEQPFMPDVIDEDLYQLIYIDVFGNAMTGIRASNITHQHSLEFRGLAIGWARTFADMEKGQPFWHENANGLVEVAVNCGSAARLLSLTLGDKIRIV